jgi:sulfite exporter TauE/SafE
MENLITVFFTGLITGGLTCMAVQGGLLAATLAQREEEKLKNNLKKGGNALPILSFLLAKLIAYTILGFLLGQLGSFFTLSITAKVIMQIGVVVFMLGTAFSILNIHPIFRYFIIQPPKFLTRLVRKQSKSQDMFAPAALGAFTVFIPCGTTQAMMALAIASGNPLSGAAILFAFVLGTSPLFFILGFFATKLGDVLEKEFMKIAAITLIILSVFNLNNAIALTGSRFTLENFGKNIYCTLWFCNASSNTNNDPVSETTITITSLSYVPNVINVKKGTDVTLHLVNKDGASCIQAFTIPSLGIQKLIPPGSSDTIKFTAPNRIGQIPFMCSMGMFRGVINVI